MGITGIPFVSSTFSRVSSALSRNTILGNLRRNQEDLLRVQEQLATGLRILRPSDDVVGSNRILDFGARVRRDEQFLRNIDRGTSRLGMSETAIADMKDLVAKAKEIVLSQVQSTATAQTRLLASQEISALLTQAVNLGNTSFEDRFLFGGSRSEAAPFLFVGGAVAFTGDVKEFQADVADGQRVSTNVTADALGVLSEEIQGVDLTAGPTFLQPVDLNPAVTGATKLSALNGGDGVRLGSIQVAGSGTATIDLTIAKTVQDVIDLINAESGTTGVVASNDADSLVLTSAFPITVTDLAGGVTAQDLGIVVTAGGPIFQGTDLDPALTEDTLVGDLFAGAGLDPSGIVITNASSTSSFTAAFGAGTFGAGVTVRQMLSDINNANLFVDARIDGSRINVVSRLSGARLTIANNGGVTATQLGLESILARASLDQLNGGLGVGSAEGDDVRITRKDGVQVFVDVDNAANVQQLVDAIDADPGLTAAIVAGGITITDVTGGVGPLTIANFNGSFAATNLGIAGTTAGAVIAGGPIPFVGVQPEGIFTSLIRLRDALATNDTVGINRAAELVEGSLSGLIEARADVGARVSSLELTKNRLSAEKVELEKLLSSTRDADMAEAATRFQLQQTVLESSLAVAARIMETSLFNFL